MKRPRLRAIGNRIKTLDTRTAKPPRKEVSPVYEDPRHAAWRARVIARADGSCEGTVAADGSRCGRREDRMFADHIVEIQDGGEPFDTKNGQCLCGSCHTRKTAAARAARHLEA